MKDHKFFIKPTLFLPALLLVFAGCHSDDGQADLTKVPAAVTPRADDCMDCGDDCCCFIELDGDDAASIIFCGTTDGASACMGSSNCGSLNGGGQLINLSVGTPRKLFCAGLNSSFRIQNFSGSDEADIIISCQAEDGTPQTLMVHLGVFPDPTFEFYYSTDGDCELDDNC